MTIKEYLEQQVEYQTAQLTDTVEVRYEDSDATVGFMSIEDMLDSEAEYLDLEYKSADKQEDGSYLILI